MAEVLVEFSEPVMAKGGRLFVARACGNEMDNNLWQGWLEFLPADGGGAIRSGERLHNQTGRTRRIGQPG